MAEVRNVSITDGTTSQPSHQYGIFATKSYSEGDVILADEYPVAVLSEASAGFPKEMLRQQFKSSALVTGKASSKPKSAKDDDKISVNSLILPQSFDVNQLSASGTSTAKLRGMILALASYSVQHALNPPSEESTKKLFELYHPSLSCDANDNEAEQDAVKLASLALKCADQMAAPKGQLKNLLQQEDKKELITKVLLIYSCNAFEGGRIYHKLSRVNHSCNPNGVVVEGEGSEDVSVLKAACDIAHGEEITISYLGKFLYAGYTIRQKLLRASKHFVCRCERCNVGDGEDSKKKSGEAKSEEDSSNYGDLASRIPCPICHPRTGRYLDEDVAFDEDAGSEDGFKICYAVPKNGLTAEERSLHCPSCKGTTAVVTEEAGSMRKKKEGMAIKYMCMAEDKIFDQIEPSGEDKKLKSDDTETEQDIDQQFLQMAQQICGAQHWTTHFLNLSLIEESLASFHSTLMTMGQDAERDAELMEDLFVEIAEAADGIERASEFASSLKLNLDPAHWMFDYTVGLARTLVGLGDVKSQKYAAQWIAKVEKYSEHFENDGMRKVVFALKDAYKRSEDGKSEKESDKKHDSGEESWKKRKVG